MSGFTTGFAVLLGIFTFLTVLFCIWAKCPDDDGRKGPRVETVGLGLILFFFAATITLNGVFSFRIWGVRRPTNYEMEYRLRLREFTQDEIQSCRGMEERLTAWAAEVHGKEGSLAYN